MLEGFLLGFCAVWAIVAVLRYLGHRHFRREQETIAIAYGIPPGCVGFDCYMRPIDISDAPILMEDEEDAEV